jgi:nicotinamidase-related amidase
MESLIIVDLQKAFPVPSELVAEIRRFAQRFERRIFTRFENHADSLFRRLLKQRCCTPGTEDTALLIEPEPRDLVIAKRGYGLGPEAIERIRRLGVDQATICGIDTDACVLGVMFSLFDAGIDCRVQPDLCWSSSGLHDTAMKIILEQFPPPKPAIRPRATGRRRSPAGGGRSARRKSRVRSRASASA